MPTATKKKTSKKITEDPLSSSGVSSLSGISSYNIRKISIFKNGDRFHRGVKFVINPRIIKDMEPLLNQINDRIELSHGAKKLYTSDGKLVASIKELEDGKIYVAASAQFIPMRYGEFTERVWKPPSRKHSPIMSADRIKSSRTRSQEPRKRREQTQQQQPSGVQRSRSVRTLNEDRKSRRDVPARNGTTHASTESPKKKPEAARPKPSIPKPTMIPKKLAPTAKKPPTPKKVVSKRAVAGAALAAGAGVAVVGATVLEGVKKAATPKAAPTTAASTASSVIPEPNIESNAAEILEFPEELKKVDVATIHRTPTPAAATTVLEAKSVSQQPTPESSEAEEEEEEDEDGDGEDEEEDVEDEGEDEEDEEEDEEEEEEEEGERNSEGVETPASRRSSSAVSSADSKDANEDVAKK